MDPILAALLSGGGLMGAPPSADTKKRNGAAKPKANPTGNINSKGQQIAANAPAQAEDKWDIYNHGPLSPTEAFRVLRRPLRRLPGKSQIRPSGDNNSHPPTQGALLLVLGLWNTNISCGPSQQGLRLTQLLKFALSQKLQQDQQRITEDYDFSLSTVVLNDQDEEFSDFIIDGPYHCPTTLPALAMYIPPSAQQVRDANRKQVKIHLSSRLQYVNMESHTLRLLLTDFSEDDRVGGHTEKDSMRLFSSMFETIESLDRLSLQDYVDSEESNALMLAVSMGGSAAMEMARKQVFDKKLKANKEKRENLSKISEPPPHKECIRIFVAGDRSQVGKSSVCLGLLGSLLHLGYTPDQLAYIKPATQCEATQPVANFCEHHGIACTPIGPLVFYKGFTREFLDGNTESSKDVLAQVSKAVDELAKGRQVVIIDGVGYPAVGSICGMSNASVAHACGYPISEEYDSESPSNDVTAIHTSDEVMAIRRPAPVLLVGKSGVGDAVDSFNLNATFFEASKVPVLGAVFNRFPSEGYYSLENCKPPIEAYFDQALPSKKAFGFLPEMKELFAASSVGEQDGKSKAEEPPRSSANEPSLGQSSIESASAFVIQFLKHVDVIGIVASAKKAQRAVIPRIPPGSDLGVEEVIRDAKRLKLVPISPGEDTPKQAKSREAIEGAAREAGAKSS
jgi:hypothetical protein